ncbi:hypothetical protein [Streptomyces sp. CB01881]|uniref:hypothetical protein n=1 Tax=Streptomyces sp. CB01881 TaxID=2078691 RepID=UPI000CDBF6D2|nr:hypothetical protein [Streptomyces sp. CB01881]AUY48600.1 hypothetical protein C2142_06180 [Streptomyces sp. CB01881]TYC77093.1 hypothetical protein EH183_06190 [Streptomyces sp. CB01881]
MAEGGEAFGVGVGVGVVLGVGVRTGREGWRGVGEAARALASVMTVSWDRDVTLGVRVRENIRD